MICSRLRPRLRYLSVRIGDGSRRGEEIVTPPPPPSPLIAPLNGIIINASAW